MAYPAIAHAKRQLLGRTVTKYKAVRAQASNGVWCASKKEASRYSELLILERAKLIKDLKWQVKMPVVINCIQVLVYVADAMYWDLKIPDVPVLVVEDIKGFRTPEYRIKKRCVEAYYSLKITET